MRWGRVIGTAVVMAAALVASTMMWQSQAREQTAEPAASRPSDRQASTDPAVLIVLNLSDRPARTSLLVRWALACDRALTRLSMVAVACLRCIVPTPRST